jgi:NTP pyrophosphatase (non-canonical NTP hydrolase)
MNSYLNETQVLLIMFVIVSVYLVLQTLYHCKVTHKRDKEIAELKRNLCHLITPPESPECSIDPQPDLSLYDFSRFNRARCVECFHPIHVWSVAEWTNALAGEVGELCNLAKKYIRKDGRTKEEGQANTPEQDEIRVLMGKEVGDIMAYLDLVCARAGIDLPTAIVNKWNEVSVRVGSFLRLDVNY